MEDNVNHNLCILKTIGEFEEDSAKDMVPFHEEITILKTEVKEEVYDFEVSINEMEFVNVKEECISSPENYFEEDGLELVKSSEQLSSENPDIGNCEKFAEADLQENKYKCELCDSNFDEEIYLRSHYDRCASAKKKLSNEDVHLSKNYKCNDCKFSTVKRGDLMRHVRIHTNERPFKCTYKNCKCKPGQEEPCNCDVCGYASLRNHDLKTHILVRHNAKPTKYRCVDCKFATYIKRKLEVHLCTYNKYKCKDCEYVTHSKRNLLAHHLSHTNERPFKCTYKNCKCAPGQEQSCMCDMCGYSAKGISTLRKHILLRHSAETKKHKCSNCNYATHDKCALIIHIRTHTNEKPYKCTYKNCKCTPRQEECCECDVCLYAAADKANLRRHILVKHNTGPKKHKCQDCEYSTHRRADLVLHYRIHTGDRPFKCTYKNCKCKPSQDESCMCDTCEYSAKANSALRKHILLKHSEESKMYKRLYSKSE